MSQNKIITTAISAVLAFGLSTSSEAVTNAGNQSEPDMSQMMGNIQGMEKCYGIAKAGRNDCGTATHNCAGESKIDNDKAAWILVPDGLCQKIVGGSLKPITDKLNHENKN